MHREQPALRREIIRNREDTFLHFTGVFGSKNDKLLVFEVEIYARG